MTPVLFGGIATVHSAIIAQTALTTLLASFPDLSKIDLNPRYADKVAYALGRKVSDVLTATHCPFVTTDGGGSRPLPYPTTAFHDLETIVGGHTPCVTLSLASYDVLLRSSA